MGNQLFEKSMLRTRSHKNVSRVTETLCLQFSGDTYLSVLEMDREIFDLIKKEDFKRCHDKVGTLRRQYPNNSYLKVLEIYVKYRQSPNKFDYENCLACIYGSNGSTITSDLSALNLLHTFFFELGEYEEALKVYERANFKYPSFNSALQWFEKSLEAANYRQLIRASQKMSKLCVDDDSTNPTSRDYLFWYSLSILAFFRFQKDEATEQETKLLPQLAYRTLSTAKPFQSTQEVTVFCMICTELFPTDLDKSKEVVAQIIPHLDTSLDLYLKNYILKHVQESDHQNLFDICCKILGKIDDYELIMKLISAGYNLGRSKAELTEKIHSLVGDSRNARLSFLETDKIFDGKISESSLLYYLSKFHNKPCCFMDIKSYRNCIDCETLKSVMSSLDNQDVIHDSNAFQLGIIEADEVALYNKHNNSLKFKPKTDYSTCSKFILSKVQSVLSKCPNDSSLESVLLALSILENYQKLDPHNFDTGVWITSLYMHLGCIPLAYSRFLGFKSKNIQIDTFDYIAYSRYSTLFPSKDNDFLRDLQSTQDRLYNSSLERYAQFIRLALKKGAYSKILGLIEFRDRLQRSSVKWMMTCERLKFARLCNDKRSELLRTMHEGIRNLEAGNRLKFSDNRDWTLFGPHVGKKSLPPTLEYLNISEQSITLNCIKELMIEAIPSKEFDDKLDKLFERALDGNDIRDVLHNCYDETDIWSFNIFYNIYKENGSKLKHYLNEMTCDTHQICTWKLSHQYLTKIQTLKTLDNFKRIRDSETRRLIKSKLNELRGSCDDLYNSYISELSTACESLSKGENAAVLSSLGFVPLNPATIKNSILTVQKTVRNL